MDQKRNGKLALAAFFGVVIAVTVWQNGRGMVVSAGAGLLGGAVFYLISRFVIG